jgi:hypothetical protein
MFRSRSQEKLFALLFKTKATPHPFDPSAGSQMRQ